MLQESKFFETDWDTCFFYYFRALALVSAGLIFVNDVSCVQSIPFLILPSTSLRKWFNKFRMINHLDCKRRLKFHLMKQFAPIINTFKFNNTHRCFVSPFRFNFNKSTFQWNKPFGLTMWGQNVVDVLHCFIHYAKNINWNSNVFLRLRFKLFG